MLPRDTPRVTSRLPQFTFLCFSHVSSLPCGPSLASSLLQLVSLPFFSSLFIFFLPFSPFCLFFSCLVFLSFPCLIPSFLQFLPFNNLLFCYPFPSLPLFAIPSFPSFPFPFLPFYCLSFPLMTSIPVLFFSGSLSPGIKISEPIKVISGSFRSPLFPATRLYLISDIIMRGAMYKDEE